MVDLAKAGRRTEALDAGQEAVDLRRELVAGNRDAYLPNLASSLWNVGFIAVILSAVDDDVIGQTEQGVRYFEELAAQEPAAFEARKNAAAKTLVELKRLVTGGSAGPPSP